MLCENCSSKTATTLIKKTVNGQTFSAHLCNECAAGMGFSSITGAINLSSLLGSVFSDSPMYTGTTSCPSCSATFNEISRAGKVGCAKCYDIFRDRLAPSLQRIHGHTSHAGKLPSSAGDKAKQRRHLDELKKNLADAIEKQEYESAALIRDEIKTLEKGGDAK